MTTSVTYTIGGVKVEFPAKAYPSQVSMMDKIIRGCSRAQNCLLESPTGSGKTLALLCGALAWQKAEKQRVDETYRTEMVEYLRAKQELEQEAAKNPEPMSQSGSQPGCSVDDQKCSQSDDNLVMIEEITIVEGEDSDIFRPIAKKFKTGLERVMDLFNQDRKGNQSGTSNAVEMTQNVIKKEPIQSQSKVKTETPSIPEPKQGRVPKIYFCTRTHKQLAQVVNEMRRTAYKDAKNTVLSSRTHSCIHDGLKYNPKMNKTELCRQLLDPKSGTGCRFQKNLRNYLTFGDLEANGFKTPWELEDLVDFGKKRTVCPYFTARSLMTEADIIFCPYNYLIDPIIRTSMKIDLKGDILIVDEAHNTEDTCREAASFTAVQDTIQNSIQECEEILQHIEDNSPKKGACQEIINVLCSLSTWIDRHKNDIAKMSDYDQGKFDMFGARAVESFKEYRFGPQHFAQFTNNYALLTTEPIRC